MAYKATKAFWDIKDTRRYYATGDTLEVSDERGEELVKKGFAEKVREAGGERNRRNAAWKQEANDGKQTTTTEIKNETSPNTDS